MVYFIKEECNKIINGDTVFSNYYIIFLDWSVDLMKYEKIKHDGYNLHVIKTDRFRTVNIALNYVGIRDKKSTVNFELLEGILLYVTKQFPDRVSLAKACGDMYDLRMRVNKQQWGKYNNFKFTCDFVNEKYTKKGMNKKSITFALKQFLNPLVYNGGFDKDVFDMMKKLYKEELLSVKDNPEFYSNMRLKEEMGKKAFYNYSISEELKILDKITEKSLYRFYKKVLKEYQLEIFVVGDVEPSEIDKIFASKIKRLTNDDSVKKFEIVHDQIRQRTKKVIETSEFAQTKLDFGFKTKDLTPFETQYVAFIYGNILGGGAGSLLFDTVRTKKSLCYYIYSTGSARSNFFQIRAGIDYKNVNKVINLTKKCITRMASGEFTEEDINKAKECYINAITESEDRSASIQADYMGVYFFEKDPMAVRKDKILEVTKEDIVKFAKKMYLDTIFILKGDKNGN